MKGADVLRSLVELEIEIAGPVSSSAIAMRTTRILDGRAVTATLKRLEHAGLARRVRPAEAFWESTARGRSVYETLMSVVVKWGGAFRPLVETDLNTTERLAVR